MNVLFVGEKGDSPCRYYRMELPMQGLRANRVNARVAHAIGQRPDGKLVGLHNNGLPMSDIPDVLIVRRLLGPSGEPMSSARLFRQAIQQGQQVWLDIDDDMWRLPEWNPARATVTDAVIRAWETDAEAATGIIVSTPALARTVVEHVPEGLTVRVIENSIDFDAYDGYRKSVEYTPLRLGWAGTTAYRWPDLEWLVPTLRHVLSTTSVPVEFWHLGNVNSRTEPHLGELLADFPVPIKYVNWCPVEGLPRSYTQIDALIIPQQEIPFNECRSAITGLAAMAAGVPYIASPLPEYQRMWRMGGGYVVGNTAEEWEAGLRIMLEPEYREARRSMANGGIALASRLRPETVARQYMEAFGIPAPQRALVPEFGQWGDE